jgi:biopolymer transport protein ExbB/TolQ
MMIMAYCAVVLTILCCLPSPVLAQATPEQRQKEEKAAEQKLTELDKKMHELSPEAKKAEESTQAELNRLFEDFKKQQGAAKGSLEELRKSTNESWEKAKKDMDKALENLNGLYERSKTKCQESSKEKAK